MITLSFAELARTVNGRLLRSRDAERTFAGVSIDSRTIRPGELFIAVQGEHRDGHAFIPDALRRGAAGVLAAEPEAVSPLDVAAVLVPDTHAAMLQLAAVYRDRVGAFRIGITGTNGKTTTKELTYTLLCAVTDSVYRSPGNYNNLFGMPLSLLAMPQDTRLAVLEMGISRPGEMQRLSDLVKPDLMVFTNVGPSHLEFLGSVEAVAKEKVSAIAAMSPEAPVIVNADDPVLSAAVRGYRERPVTFGMEAGADVHPTAVELAPDGTTQVTIQGHRFHLALYGRHHVYNLLAAFAVCRTLGYDFAGVDTTAVKLSSADMRGQIVRRGRVTFINDCYNANPDSMRSGLESFARFTTDGRKVVVLGDMLEIGPHEKRYHPELGEQLARLAFDLTVLVGPRCRLTAQAAARNGIAVRHFDDAGQCASEISSLLKPGDVVFVKASRGIGLERVIRAWPAEEED